MELYDYIDKYGIYSFKQRKFNEVDNAIFSFLSYANFSGILDNGEVMTLQEAANKHIEIFPGKDKNVIAVREGNKLLRYIKDLKRYKNCILSNYEYIGGDRVQFCALSIEYENNKVYVSFEGTDELFSGWIEDFMLSYKFPTFSHKIAISYLNRHYTFSFKELIIGGHSKGGNLALVASMYANYIVKRKIKKIYNNDGPGLLDKEFSSNRYKSVLKKYVHIIPNYSLVGLLLNNSNVKVVNSVNKSILAHDIVFWSVEDNHFKKTKLSFMSQQLDNEIKKWLVDFKEQDRMEFVDNLDKILKKAKVTSILDLKLKKERVFNLIYQSKDISATTKKTLLNLFIIMIKCLKNTKKEEIKSFWSNIFSISSKDT